MEQGGEMLPAVVQAPALDESEVRLTRVIAGLAGGVLLEDEHRRIVVVNQAFCDLFAIAAPPDVLVGADCAAAASQSAALFRDAEAFLTRVHEILAARVPVNSELIVMADGRRVERDYVPIWIDDTYRGHLWHYRDVSAREYALKQVRRGERRFRALVGSSPVGVFELAPDGRATFVSESGWSILGRPRGRDIDSRWQEAVHPDDREGLAQAWRAALAGDSFAHEYRVVRRVGDLGYVVSCAVPIVGDDGRTSGWIGTLHDITQIRRLERGKDEFIAMASHELRTPLAAIRTFAELLAGSPLGDEQAQQLEVIQRNTLRLARLVDDLLTLAREDLKRVDLQREPVDLAAVADHAVQAASPAAAERQVTLRRTGAGALPITGDPARLGQVLDNLLSNALRFAPVGTEVTVDVRPGRDVAVVEVRDEGQGVDPAQLDRLFERFFQVTSGTGPAAGTGLGLSVVRAIAEAHGGTAHAWAPAGGGLAVTIELPGARRA